MSQVVAGTAMVCAGCGACTIAPIEFASPLLDPQGGRVVCRRPDAESPGAPGRDAAGRRNLCLAAGGGDGGDGGDGVAVAVDGDGSGEGGGEEGGDKLHGDGA